MTPDIVTKLPCWTGTPKATPLQGGLSNESWLVRDDLGQHVARFGEDYPFHHVSRAREVAAAKAAHAAGFGPAVEFAAQGVSVVAYIPSQTWRAQDVCAAPARIGHLLRAFHRDMPRHIQGSPAMFWPFHVIRDYARTIAAGESPFAADLPRYVQLCAQLEAAQIPMPIVFGHHDLLPANILDDGTKLWLIDYEYAGFGTAMFDLAGAASNAGMNQGQTQTLLQAYFGHSPDAAFMRAFDAMQCTSLLREAMWAMVSDIHLRQDGTNYREYAVQNLNSLKAALEKFTQTYGML